MWPAVASASLGALVTIRMHKGLEIARRSDPTSAAAARILQIG